MSGSSAPQDVVDLVSKFGVDEGYYTSTTKNYLEADVRSEFIDPLLQALGWDTANKAAVTPLYREVVREESQEREDSAAKKPDYTLRHNGKARLYVEAKKPSVNILTHFKSIAQARSYGYTQGHPISALTNFKDLSVYDTSIPVTEVSLPRAWPCS